MERTILVWVTVAAPFIGFAVHWWLAKPDSDSVILANSRQTDGDYAQLKRRSGGRLATRRGEVVADFMMVIVSILVLCSALFIILSGRYDTGSQKWAFGAVGSIVGFWLRGRK